MSPDLRFGDDSTPLTRSVLMDNEALARALLDRGADVNLCSAVGCPLQVARVHKDENRRLLWFDLLLAARGANPDAVDTTFAGASTTVLSSAAYDADMSLLRRLLAAGASPDGAPGVTATPLETALAGGRREVAELLLQRGASVLPLPDRSIRDPATGVFGRGNAWLAAGEAQDPALQAWVESLMLTAARANPAYAVDAFIEQDGKRQPLADGATLALRAAAFKLVFRLSGQGSAGVVLGTSFSPQFAAAARRSTRGNGLLIPTRSSALTNTPEPGSYDLLAYDAPPPGLPAGQSWGAHMALRPVTDSRDRRDFHAENGREYTREVRTIQPVPEEGDLPPAEPAASLKGRSLALVFGSTLLLDPIEWAPWVQVRSVTLNFR